MALERDLAGLLRGAGMGRGDLAGLVVAPDGTAAVVIRAGAAGLAAATAPDRAVPKTEVAGAQPADAEPNRADADFTSWIGSAAEVGAADVALRPRWVTWSGESAARLTAAGVRLATCWDIAAVHRLLFGGWRADPGWVWAHARGLPPDGVPTGGPARLFETAELFAAELFESAELVETAGHSAGRNSAGHSAGRNSAGSSTASMGSPGSGGPADDAIGAGGYLRREWAEGGWAESAAGMIRWARLALETAGLQYTALSMGTQQTRGPHPETATRRGEGIREVTAHSESAAELLCAELGADGLPVDRATAERLLTGIIGPRPASDAEGTRLRSARDERVLRHAPAGVIADLRSPVQVRAMLAAAGIDVRDTRAWRLKPFRDAHPLVAALLDWRKAERIATTYGYPWLDAFLGSDGRLRGAWTGSDGAAGRMTASAGLHNMPSVLRQAVIAADGFLFVRADLGQIEPRVLAAVSGDRALADAAAADDMYLPVAEQLGVDRPTAKVAMIAAMYGQTTGHGGQAGRRMKVAYPVAMAYLDDADRRARAGRDLRTHGGRLVRMSGGRESAAGAAARGRYGRNAMIQGAAAELFKMWAVTVRTRSAPLGARIVLCLHDELLVHVPEDKSADAARLVTDCLAETARRWAPGIAAGGQVRFLADVSAVRCWADAKA